MYIYIERCLFSSQHSDLNGFVSWLIYIYIYILQSWDIRVVCKSQHHRHVHQRCTDEAQKAETVPSVVI